MIHYNARYDVRYEVQRTGQSSTSFVLCSNKKCLGVYFCRSHSVWGKVMDIPERFDTPI